MESLKGYAVYIISSLGHVVNWSNAAQEIFEFTAKEVIGKPLGFFYTEEAVQKNEVQHNLEQAIKTGQYKTGGWRKKNGGEKLWAEDIFTVLYKNDAEPDGFLVLTTPVSKNGSHEEVTDPVLAGAEEKFKTYNQELKMLASHLQTVREEERAAMAREIHDELGQQITGLKMDVSWLDKRIQHEDESVKKRIKTVIGLLDDTVKMVRKIASDLRPGILDDFGLIDALQWYSKEFEKNTGIVVDLQVAEDEINIDKNKITGLFRIYQESLANVAAYSGAGVVNANIYIEGDKILFTISYIGSEKKEKEDADKRKLRLMDMRERMLMMGGSYEIKNNPAKGTTVYVSVPLHKA